MNAPLTPEKILQVGLGFWASKTLLSAVEMEVFTELAKHPEDLKGLQERLGLHPRSAQDFLDALVALGFLNRVGANTRTPLKRTCSWIRESRPMWAACWTWLTAGCLAFGIISPKACAAAARRMRPRAGGESLFAALYASPARLKEFLSAMTGLSHPANLAIAHKFPWKNYKRYVDVGTAQGDLAVQVALANPHLSGVGFDLPEVEPIFEEYAQRNGLSGRLSFAKGDFFNTPIPETDVVMMGHILHDWDLQEKKTLIRKAYDAVRPGGALIVYESIIDDDRSKNVFGLLMSLNMLIETQGGFDYTGADCMGWMKEIGFKETRVEHLVGPDSMVVGIK